jgi:hypothetical protein
MQRAYLIFRQSLGAEHPTTTRVLRSYEELFGAMLTEQLGETKRRSRQ